MFVSSKTSVGILIFPLVILLLYFGVSPAEDQYALKRMQMVELDIRGRGIKDSVVLSVMNRVQHRVFPDAHPRDEAERGAGCRTNMPRILRAHDGRDAEEVVKH